MIPLRKLKDTYSAVEVGNLYKKLDKRDRAIASLEKRLKTLSDAAETYLSSREAARKRVSDKERIMATYEVALQDIIKVTACSKARIIAEGVLRRFES